MMYKYGNISYNLNLKKGQLVKVETPLNEDMAVGEILEFVNYDAFKGGFVVKNFNGRRFIFASDKFFITFPSQEEVKTLIDLALDLGDEEWFNELTYVMNYETDSSIKLRKCDNE